MRAFCPPARSRTAFIRIDASRAAVLLRKVGLPLDTTCRIRRAEKRGRQNRRGRRPRQNGQSATSAQRNMPHDTASADPPIPMSSTDRQSSSSPIMSADIRILRNMLLLMRPQMRKKLSTANTMVVTGEQTA